MGFLELRRQCGVSHEVPRGSQGASCVAPGKSSIPFECKLELGIALQSLQGKIDLIYACVQDLVFHYWANRDLGVAFPTHQGFQVSSRGEAKDSALLSSRTGMSWSPLSGLKGVKPPLVFRGRTRDCSPGNAGNEGPHLAMTGASRRFSRAVALVWGFSRSKTGSSVSLSCGARAVRSLCTW